MSIMISFELSDDDVEHFAALAREAQEAFKQQKIKEDEIIEATSKMLADANELKNLPEFIASRLTVLQVLINMIQDQEWKLEEEDKLRVLGAMAYFEQPEDLIPDRIPGIGFLDDAIMIELIERDLEPEISTYRDFCQYRIAEIQRRQYLNRDPEVTINDWLADKRATLQSRMRQRRKISMSQGGMRIFR